MRSHGKGDRGEDVYLLFLTLAAVVARLRKVLQEAKGPRYAALLQSMFGGFVAQGLERQAGRQIDVARGRPIEWYFAEEPARRHFSKLKGTRPIAAMHVPAR